MIKIIIIIINNSLITHEDIGIIKTNKVNLNIPKKIRLIKYHRYIQKSLLLRRFFIILRSIFMKRQNKLYIIPIIHIAIL